MIGTRWDADNTSPVFSLTHASGFSKHSRAQLTAMCDLDLEKARWSAEHWGALTYYTDPRALFSAHKIDVAVVATSSEARWEIIEAALTGGVKVLVIEKPLATTLAESRKLISAIDTAGTKAIINYSRNWDPSMLALRDRIRAGEMGALQRITGTYGKGISNNGSHMIDLCSFLCDARPKRARSLGSPLDYEEAAWSSYKDRAFDAQVEFELKNGNQVLLTMLATDHNAFTCFDLRIIGRQALCEISKGGRNIHFALIEADTNYIGYSIPGKALPQPARLLEAMDLMVDEALRLAAGEIQSSSCDANKAFFSASAVDAINRSADGRGCWLDVSLP